MMRYFLILTVLALVCLFSAQQVGPSTTPAQQSLQLSLPEQTQSAQYDIAPRGIQSPAEQPSVVLFDAPLHIVQELNPRWR